MQAAKTKQSAKDLNLSKNFVENNYLDQFHHSL